MLAPSPGRRARSRISVKPANLPAVARKGARSAPSRAPLALVRNAELPAERGGMPPRIARFMATAELPSPCLVVDVDLVAHNFSDLAAAIPGARVFYAVKANPAREILARLAGLGSCFDTASLGEIDLCLSLGVGAERISYGNTIKKQRDIAAAFARGVRLFAFDSAAELDKLAESAPGASVYCRVLMDGAGAEWPLSRKFGCEPEMAEALLFQAASRGLDACGISFHVGSQQTDLAAFDRALALTAGMFERLAEKGVRLRLVNLGGGFPARYRTDVPSHEAYGKAILESVARRFAAPGPELIIEPGRGVVGDAGVIQAEVVLVAQKGGADERRWVYLDIGKFHGLAETMDEAIKYRLLTQRDGGETSPVVLAGPTCDSADVLYEAADYRLPLDLKAGDKVWILATGAYTTTYSAVAFNGFPPLASLCI
jgi:ornithine decarboxylase